MLSRVAVEKLVEMIDKKMLAGEPIDDYEIVKELVLEGLIAEDVEVVWDATYEVTRRGA